MEGIIHLKKTKKQQHCRYLENNTLSLSWFLFCINGLFSYALPLVPEWTFVLRVWQVKPVPQALGQTWIGDSVPRNGLCCFRFALSSRKLFGCGCKAMLKKRKEKENNNNKMQKLLELEHWRQKCMGKKRKSFKWDMHASLQGGVDRNLSAKNCKL